MEADRSDPGSRARKALPFVVVVTLILMGGIIAFIMTRPGGEAPKPYDPTIELTGDYILITDDPSDATEMLSIASLVPLAMKDGSYHPLIVLGQDGSLLRQQLYTLTHMKEDRTKVLFSNDPETLTRVNSQLTSAGLSPVEDTRSFPLAPDICGEFMGFKGVMTVSTYEEALWAVPVACHDGMALVQGDRTFVSQEESWRSLQARGVPADYIVVTNPHDLSLETLRAGTPDYDPYDDPWFCPGLSVSSAIVSGYHTAHVMTNATPVEPEGWGMDISLSQNRRAAGYLTELRAFSSQMGIPEYITLVGSASAIPQFLMPGPGEGEIVNSDVVYGFLDDDMHTMDASMGRIIQYDLSLASNQLMKTYDLDMFEDEVEVQYRSVAGGTHMKDWRTHGASFSGFDITYKRMQATPARWLCTDFNDAGFTYDYIGPSDTGVKIADGVVNSKENDLSEICEGAGYVAYRGHGSDYGSLYGIRVYGPNGEEHQLSSEDVANMDVPPQVAFFVSCLNGKIYGHGPGTDPGSDIDFTRLFTLNYLSAGPAVLVGATEVSFSNIGQDLTTLPEEYLPGVINPEWSDGDYEWDHNDAWYAFVWDGLLNHPGEHGTVGKAVKWSENRYMAYPPNNDPTPLQPTGEVDWYEVTFFATYGDPAFRPAIDPNSSPGYDPWHNGPEDI